ncbi:beta-glucuronidase [Arthrobacter pigmenti]
MLKPQNGPTRELVSLDGLYRFKVDFDRSGHAAAWQSGGLETDLEIAVPSSYNDIFADQRIRDHVGYVWYQRQVRVPRGWDGDRIIIRVGSATHEGMVYVDDALVAEHVGGYMPFEADITDHVTAGGTFRLTIAVNNELTQATIPPGTIEVTEDGRRKQTYMHDFYNYAGLHRSVELYSVPATRVDDITVTTSYEGSTGSIRYSTAVTGPGAGTAGTVSVRVADASGREVATGDGAEGTVDIDDVVLWKPGAGYLYNFTVEVHDGGGELLDSYTLPVGIRTIEVDGPRFLINGEPFYFTGFGMHEDHNTVGKAHNNAMMVNDFQLLDWIGANSFRTSHYPYAEEVMDFADRHGIVVIDETAAVGLNLGMGGGIMNGRERVTFADGNVDAKTQESHRQALTELIARDKNHPSVVLWSVANEPDSGAEGAREYFEPLVKLTRELDPSRPVGFVNVMFAPAGVCKISDLFDVLMLNRYYGWYVQPGDLAEAEVLLERELLAWQQQYDKPMIMTEYGTDTMPGVHSIYDQPWSEEYQSRYLEMYHRVFDRVEAMIGEHVWNFADFQTSAGFARVDGNKKGAFTRDRKPKAGAHALRARWTEESRR